MTTKIFFTAAALIIVFVIGFFLYNKFILNSTNSTIPIPMNQTHTNSSASKVEVLQFNKEIYIGSEKLKVALANTPAKQAKGLSDQESLAEGTGMLFDYKNSKRTQPGFWMKQMKFNIDIIWVRDGEVVDLTEDIPAPTADTREKDLPLYYPKESVDTVIEVPAGWSKKNSISIGTKVIQ